MGAYLVAKSHSKVAPFEFYAIPIPEMALGRFGYKLGDSKGQQTWEAPNMLIALGQWSPKLRSRRVAVELKGDNIAALTPRRFPRRRGLEQGQVGDL